MRVPRLLVNGPLSAGAHVLDPDTTHYLVSVLRRKAGDAVRVFNGTGWSANGTVIEAQRKRCVLDLEAPFAEDLESPLSVELGLALLRGERMDLALQKACELGVTKVTPLRTERTEVRLEEKRLANRMRHWREVLRHAVQQSGRSAMPELSEPVHLDEALSARGDRVGFILDPTGESDDAVRGAPTSVVLLTGPEGGFSDIEVARATTAGWRRLRLGPRILRAETAPIVGLAVLQARYGDLATR